MEPLLSPRYVFEVNGQLLNLDSDSHVGDMVYGQNTEELRFTLAEPTGIKGEMAVTIPVSLIAGDSSIN